MNTAAVHTLRPAVRVITRDFTRERVSVSADLGGNRRRELAFRLEFSGNDSSQSNGLFFGGLYAEVVPRVDIRVPTMEGSGQESE